jgi:putative MATE family efflux protein
LKPETKQIAQIAVPVSLEFVVILLLNFVTQIIVGGLGAVPIAAVGFANSLTFIMMVTISALGTSVGILSARAFGGGRMHELNQTVSIAIVFAATLTFFSSMILFFFPYQVLKFTGASDAVASTGVDYLRFASLSLLGNVIGAVLSGVFRSVGRPKLPLYATVWTLLLNAVLSYALVYGIWLPELGVAGAGVATVVAATLKALTLGYQLFVVYNVTNFEIPRSIKYWIEVIRPLFVLAIPLGLTELVWTVGQFAYGVIVQQISDESLAAFNVANSLEGIFIVGSLGLAVAATVLVGRAVGGGDVATVNRWIHLIKRTGIFSGLVFGAMYAISALAVPIGFQNAGSDVQRLAISLIFAQALVQVVKVRNMILGGGILTSGSDIRGVIYGDAVGALVVGIPLAFALGLYTPLGIWGIVIGRAADEIVKVLIFEYRARRIDWQKLIDSQTLGDGVTEPEPHRQ